jgi:transcriptional regulator with XRE-family HTH domain
MTRRELKAIRYRLGFSQAELARHLGVTREAVTQWESGVRPIVPLTALAVEHVFQVQSRKKKRAA